MAGAGCEISEDKRSITCMEDSYRNTSYGNVDILSMRHIEYKWKIKINAGFGGYISIGISSNDEYDEDYTAWRNDGQYVNYHHYGYNGWGGYIISKKDPYGTRYSEHFAAGDVIDMILNLKSKELSFCKNGKNLGVAFDNIETTDDLIYRLAISIGEIHTNLTIIEFTEKYLD